MPGTYTVDTSATFAAALLMASAAKMKFGTDQQDMTANGERKWEIQAAVTFVSEYGMRPVSEVISVSIPAGTDPAGSIAPGSAIEFERFRVGISAPERGQGDRIRGGKPWYQAAGVRAVQTARQPVSVKSE
jgi:hypothetical protein